MSIHKQWTFTSCVINEKMKNCDACLITQEVKGHCLCIDINQPPMMDLH